MQCSLSIVIAATAIGGGLASVISPAKFKHRRFLFSSVKAIRDVSYLDFKEGMAL